MLLSSEIRHGRHSLFRMHVHFFITKYRRRIFDQDAIGRLRAIFEKVCVDFESRLVEMHGETDPVHLLINYPPKHSVSALVNSLKGVSSRMLRLERPDIQRRYWKGALWSPSYFSASCGGTPISILREYIENQNVPFRRPYIPAFKGQVFTVALIIAAGALKQRRAGHGFRFGTVMHGVANRLAIGMGRPQRGRAVDAVFIQRVKLEIEHFQARLVEVVVADDAMERLKTRVGRRHSMTHHFDDRVASRDLNVFLAAPSRTRAADILIEKKSRANDGRIADAT